MLSCCLMDQGGAHCFFISLCHRALFCVIFTRMLGFFSAVMYRKMLFAFMVILPSRISSSPVPFLSTRRCFRETVTRTVCRAVYDGGSSRGISKAKKIEDGTDMATAGRKQAARHIGEYSSDIGGNAW